MSKLVREDHILHMKKIYYSLIARKDASTQTKTYQEEIYDLDYIDDYVDTWLCSNIELPPSRPPTPETNVSLEHNPRNPLLSLQSTTSIIFQNGKH